MESLSQEMKRDGGVETAAVWETHEDSIRRMAVLFTDIVGSSRFFKTFGDVAGRRMLKEHEGIATPPILEHGGVVVKMLGDSLMAYFFHPLEAVKSAIKIQQRFREFNSRKALQEDIHVRIAVHFGDGILEEEDIFGDVVNMAAKFLPLVGGDEVCISHAVYVEIQSVSNLGFERLAPSDGLPDGLQLYRVNWAENLELDPLMKTLLFMKPLFALAKTNFRRTWELFLKERAQVLASAVEVESLRPDRSLALILREPALSLPAVRNSLEFLRLNLGMDGSLYLPLQIVIDIGPFLRGEKLEVGDLRAEWEQLEPGQVHVSAPAYHILKSRGALSGLSSTPDGRSHRFYRVKVREEERKESCLFLYQNTMIHGDLSPCFYCGDRRHPAARCPSKKLTDMSDAIARVGYLPLDDINQLFLACLKEDGLAKDPPQEDRYDLSDTSSWAFRSFYELRSIYQLRGFRTVWNGWGKDWDKVREGKGGNDRGGLVWIAQDCIRVSNLDQAETILRDSLAREPEDYKPLCAMGFLHVEKDDFTQAKFYFKKALDRCQTNPQRVLVLFLLSRVHQIQGDLARAEEQIRRVLQYSPHCAEALYEDILLQFRKGKDAIAVHQLMKLVRRDRNYYIHALIDPELAGVRELVHPKIKALLAETREQASSIVRQASDELSDLMRWLGDDEPETKDAEALLTKIVELSKVDSYFSQHDILHYGTNVVGMGRRSLEERKKKIGRILKELEARHARCIRYVNGFPYRFLVGSFAQALSVIQAPLGQRWGVDEPVVGTGKFKDVLRETERFSEELTEIESRLQRMEILRKLLLFLGRFFKRMLIFQSANLMVAIILFPIIAYYLNLLLPGMNISSQNIWPYQKTVLSLGAVSGLLLALLTSGANPGSGQGKTAQH
jgi:class 3 adenylate cyclase/tetratricopeptide (TPR) repeat protein